MRKLPLVYQVDLTFWPLMAVNDRFWPFWPWQAVKIGRISKIDPLLIELLIQIDSGATEESPCIIFFRNGSVGREIWHFRYFLVPPQAAKGG